MGITNHCAKFILHCFKLGVSYRDTIMLGRQVLYASPNVIGSLTNGLTRSEEAASENPGKVRYAESFFRLLGGRGLR